MRISVITVVYNGASSVKSTILSVANQEYPDIEHIVVDGGSTDGTQEILRHHEDKISCWVSEPDRGIYDAMNKGVALASGDIIGFLNADDTFAHNRVLGEVAKAFEDETVDACYADLVYVNDGKIVRYYRSDRFTPAKIAWGWMPAHPTLYVRRSLFEEFGGFKLGYRISADYEFVARVLGNGRRKSVYIPDVWVRMSMGGISTRSWKNRWILNREIVQACRENGIYTNLAMVLSKIPLKLVELLRVQR